MANRQTKSNQPLQPNQIARVDQAQLNKYSLPGDLLADLEDAFRHYEKQESGYISMTHFRNILHNFGFHRFSKKEIDEELKKADPDFIKRQAVEFDTVKYVVARRWNVNGKDDEARECFKLFDKRDRNYINAGDLKQVLSNYLEFPVSEADIQDFINECGGNQDGSGNIMFKEFAKLYLS